jgi:hypothetical protein
LKLEEATKVVATNLRKTVQSILKKTALLVGVITGGDTAGTVILSIGFRQDLFHYYTLLTLIEAALVFLVAGAIDIAGSVSFRRITRPRRKIERSFVDVQKDAQQIATYVATGVVLLVVSFALAYVPN